MNLVAAAGVGFADGLRQDLAEHLGLRTLHLTPLYRGPLGDSPEIVRVDTDGPPLVVVYSSDLAPLAAQGAATKSRMARSLLGAVARERVAEVLHTGNLLGRTYSVHPYLHGFSQARPFWLLQRHSLRPAVFAWLRQVLTLTKAVVPRQGMQEQFIAPLEALADLQGLPADLRAACDRSRGRIAHGAWSPSWSLMHGDFWRGNLLLRQRSLSCHDFAVIDWGGSDACGYPLVDLLRVAESLQVSREALQREIAWHLQTVGSAQQDAQGYVLAWIGSLVRRKDQLPRDRILELARMCMDGLRGSPDRN